MKSREGEGYGESNERAAVVGYGGVGGGGFDAAGEAGVCVGGGWECRDLSAAALCAFGRDDGVAGEWKFTEWSLGNRLDAIFL